MDNAKSIVLWIAGFAGVVLIYSAYKDEHPTDIITGALGGTPTGAPKLSTVPAPVGGGAGPPMVAASYDVPLIAGNDGYTYDANGNMVGTIPAVYSHSPATYIPSRSTNV